VRGCCGCSPCCRRTGSELPGGDAAAWLKERLTIVPQRYEVSVVVRAPAAAVRASVGQWSVVEEIDAASCRMLMSTDSLDWPVMAVGVIGADFHVERPAELAAKVRAVAALLARSASEVDGRRPRDADLSPT
jgi:predicted DNA-binding transcriptional regulator YafY